MKMVLLHSDWIEFKPREKAVKTAEETSKKEVRVEEALVTMVTVEKEDNIEVVEKAARDILDVFRRVKAERIVLYPWAHLSSNLASPINALEILKKLELKLTEEGIEVVRAPFGWYKAFKISVKGHPLSELSREIKPGEEKKKEERKGVEKKYVILTPDGMEINVESADLNEFNRDFQIMVRKEALGEALPGGESKVIRYLRRFGFEWEPYSDYGHMRMEPYGALIFDLVADYSRTVTRKLGIPIFEVKGTAFFNLHEKPVKEHAELYGDRLYMMETDRGEFVLRYAACHQQFSMLKDWTISYKDLPFGAFEIADSYRYEQSGEVELSFRLRRFYMPDLHVFTKDEEEAKEWLLKVHRLIMDEIKLLGRNYELLINVVNPEQYERYKDFIVKIAQEVGKPVLVAIYPATGANYYWTINIEYHIVDVLNRPREIGTVQIDIGNAKRFGIKYVDADQTEKYPVILHTAIIGTIERYIFTLFDTALQKKHPMLPVWISPVQVRIMPITNELLDYAEEVAQKIENEGFRVDIDDTSRPLGRKIVDAEREWIPYIVVVGQKEKEAKKISVRVRESGETVQMSVDELINRLREETKGYPRKPIYFSRYLSKRPRFMHLD